MNIAFPFVILMSQDYGKEASSITVFEKFSQYWEQKLTNLLTFCSKRLHMRNWDTILESHGSLDKTVYGESSVKAVGIF